MKRFKMMSFKMKSSHEIRFTMMSLATKHVGTGAPE